MTDASAPDLQAPAKFSERARKWITSTVLITFTAVVGVVCVIALSSTLMQTRMSTIVIDGVPLNIWKLNDIRIQWSTIRNQIRVLREDFTAAEQRRSVLAGEGAAVEQQFQVKQTALNIQLSEFNSRLRAIDPELVQSQTGKQLFDQYGQLRSARDRLLKDNSELKPFYDELDRVYHEYGDARTKRVNAQAASAANVLEIKGLQDAAKGTETSLESLFSEISAKSDKLDISTRSRVENALYELQSEGGLLAKYVNRLVMTQPDILTLTLVILMGVLGSSLQMTYAFFKRHQIETVGAYLLRVCVGAITALVIFIVAKAGVPVIADSSRLGGDAAINPYFVSFLAIISGLMSENAILNVQNQGARFFGPDTPGEPPRWARQDLHETFKTANREPERVKRLLQAKDDEFEGWVSGKEPMPANVQMIIAGVLQTPARDLFTDIPPDQTGTTV